MGNGGGLIGVVELFGEEAEPRDEGLIRTLAIVGEQIGGFVERRRAEESLRASEERFRAIVSNAPAGVAEGDLSGNFTFVNQTYCNILGYTREELIGTRMQDVTHPDDVARNVELYERLAAEGTSFQIEKRYVRKDGSLVWVSNHVTAARDALGKPQRAFAVTLDITEHKKAEDERERLAREAASERARLEAVLQQMPAGVFIAEPSGKLVLSNAEARRIYGGTVESVEECGRNSASYPNGEGIPPGDWPLTRSLERGETVSGVEHYVRRSDGTKAVVNANSAPVRDEEGRVVAAVKSFLDVTWRKQAEEEHERLRQQDWALQAAVAERGRISRELHDRVAHEMAVVHQSLQLYGAIDAGEHSKSSPRLQRAIEMTKSALDSTRNLSAELRRSDAEESLEETLREFVEAAVPPELTVEVSVDGDESAVPGHVRGQVFLILREAVRNAVNHSGCRKLVVRMEVSPEKIVGRAEDDGHGFDARDENGHGVGLKSMKERTELLGGSLRLTSEPRSGAKIEVSIPLSVEQE